MAATDGDTVGLDRDPNVTPLSDNHAMHPSREVGRFDTGKSLVATGVIATVRRTNQRVAQDGTIAVQHTSLATVTSCDVSKWFGDCPNRRSSRTLNEQSDSRDSEDDDRS